MKTLARETDRAEIVRRAGTIRAESVRRWGRMSPHQMICHLADACLMATGDRRVGVRTSLFRQSALKWIVLYVPWPWPAGIPTSPELDQECSGTAPSDFAADLARFEALLERLATRDTADWPAHPIFGRMSRAAWLRWAYLHADHHLRQFGA